MSHDDFELNELLSQESQYSASVQHGSRAREDAPDNKSFHTDTRGSVIQWTTGDGKRFLPAGVTQNCLTPGVYEINQSSTTGIYFEKIPVRTEGLLRFPQTNSDRVVQEIHNFWEKEAIFREYGIAYKRGIILWGPPGSGKSCTIQLIIQDVINRGGVVVKFCLPSLFIAGIRILKEIQKDTPVVTLMEDLDGIMDGYSPSEVLNVLDGVDEMDKMLFLATTNYPERLGARIINRPSRFDKRFKIDHPDAESRAIYFKYLIGEDKIKEMGIPLEKWVEDTKGLSIAHLKELFVAVVILGDEYEQAIDTLSSMKEAIDSEKDRDKQIGFHGNKKQIR